MKVDWRIELPHWILVGAMFALAALTWSSAPDLIPMHWNAAGAVNRYGGKLEGLLLMPAVATGLYFLLLLAPRIDPGRANYSQFAGVYNVCRLAILAFFSAFYAMIILIVRGHAIDVSSVVNVLIGSLFIVLGSLMGKLRPNWFIGIRTPWTLSSKLAWNKTHRLGGWLFLIAGVAIMASATLPAPWRVALMVLTLFAIGALATIYSWFVWRSDPDKLPPAGTMPA